MAGAKGEHESADLHRRLGSTEIARKNWEHFAVGAALSGVTIVCGENVCGIDPASN